MPTVKRVIRDPEAEYVEAILARNQQLKIKIKTTRPTLMPAVNHKRRALSSASHFSVVSQFESYLSARNGRLA